MLKKLKNWLAGLKQRFRSYDEEMLSGVDVEALLKDPNGKEKAKEQLEIFENRYGHIKEDYEGLVYNYSTLEKIQNLPSREQHRLEMLCRQYSEASMHTEEALKSREEATSKKDPIIEKRYRDIPKAIQIMEENEKALSLVKHDLGILEGERENLVYQQRNLVTAIKFLKGFFIFLIAAAFIGAVILASMSLVYEQPIFTPALVYILVVAFFFMWMFIFRRYCYHELKKNQIMLDRAIKLINKTKIKYVQHQQVLDYQYEKYQVNSSHVIKMRYEQYNAGMEKERDYNRTSQEAKTIIIDIDRFLNEQRIDGTEFVLREADYLATDKGRKQLVKRYKEDRDTMKHQLQQLEQEREVLMNVLTNF